MTLLATSTDCHLFEASPFPAILSRLSDDVVIAVNRRATEIVKISAADVVGHKVTEFYVNPEERTALVERLRRGGKADDMLLQVGPAGRPTRWLRVSSSLVSVDDEATVLSVFNDVTEQVSAEHTLRANEQRLADQSEALTALTAQASAAPGFEQRLADLLETAAQTLRVERVSMWRFGDERDDLLCADLFERTAQRHTAGAVLRREHSPEYFEAIERERVIAAADAHNDPRTCAFADAYLKLHGIGAMLDVPLRQRDSTIGVVCVEHVGAARAWTVDERNFALSVANLVSAAIAEHEREHAVRRLAENEARVRLVLDTAHDAFVGMHADGNVVAWNRQAAAIFGYSREEAVGQPLASLIIPPAFRAAHQRGLARFLATGEGPILNRRLEVTALNRDGQEFPIEITVTNPIRSDGGTFFGAFLRDISDRRRHEEELRKAKEAAEAATQAKSEFLANMSHELRTPLNGVLGYAQLLQRDRHLAPEQREALDAIATCGAHLLDLINDVLDLSRIEARRIDHDPAPTDLRRMAADLEQMFANQLRRKGIRFALQVADAVPAHVQVDGRHLRQVLFNLLGNAVKFTARGEIFLAIGVEEQRLVFDVIDTGAGIEAASLERIFEAFSQTEAGRAAGGTGLGLTISARLVRAMGGQLDVESTPGRGSRFYFSLPLTTAAEVPSSIPIEEEGVTIDARLAPDVQLTALVADDNIVNRRVLASILESAGARVVTADGGLEAVELAARHLPDVVLMDRRMADLDGFEATRRIHAQPETARTKVFAVSAGAFGDVREEAREAGCVDFIPKPIRAEVLFAKLRQHLGVTFVSPRLQDPPDAPAVDGRPVERLAERLQSAAAIGDVTELTALARELAAGPAATRPLASRVAQLAGEFEFGALQELASSL
jgi:PAS domain S-box-containing protein